MKKRARKLLCMILTVVLLCGCVPTVMAAQYTISTTVLSLGKNKVSVDKTGDTTLYVFQPNAVGAYEVSVSSATATLSYWYGTKFYVAGLAQSVSGGSKLTIECPSVGQTFLIGLSGVSSATITIAEKKGYVPPQTIVYKPYQNVHTPRTNFKMPTGALHRLDVMRSQVLVADANGIYHLESVSGPTLYVNMCAATYADLYACYHPTGGAGALTLRGCYQDAAGKTCGYEFLEAMRPYAEALDSNGYYYLTEDLATFIQIYGASQGWFTRESSPFPLIKQGRFIAESAWLVNVYYAANQENNRTLGLLQQHLNGWQVVINRSSLDMDGNGILNNRDLGLLQQKLNGWFD